MDAGIDEVDLALLDGMHVNPRASFDELGSVLGISGVTVRRRWDRLTESGRAWVSSALGPSQPVVSALVEAECRPGFARSVAAQWAQLPHAFSVHLITGRWNLYALVVSADEPMLSDLILKELAGTEGVRAIRSARLFRLFSGTFWRLGAISAHQAREVAAPRTHVRLRQEFDELDHRMYSALQYDGRMSYRDLAAQVGCSESAARRRQVLLVRSGLLTFRADFARAEAGWPTNVVLLIALPAEASVEVVGSALADWPETRVCAAIIGGSAQLFVTMQVHELGALTELTQRLQRCYPGMSILSARVMLEPVKSFSRLLDRAGHSCAVVPVDPWAPLDCA